MEKLRNLILAITLFGLVGLSSELLLLEHYEDIWQRIPLGLLLVALFTIVFRFLKRGRASMLALRTSMSLLVLGGLIGLYLHYDGNMEFELEMEPDLTGFDLFAESMTGATPTLAPGALIQLGLLGLLATYGGKTPKSENSASENE